MSAIEISEDEVECAFLGLDVNKGPCPEGITPAIALRIVNFVHFIEFGYLISQVIRD
jgi:hypothetical protein